MESSAEEDKAIETLDGAEWMDRQLKVNYILWLDWGKVPS